MDFEPSKTFKDPELKRAIHDLMGNHKASGALRQKVLDRMAAEPLARVAPTRPPTALWAKVAATLMIIGAAGYGAYQYNLYRVEEAVIAQAQVLEKTLLDSLVAAHATKTRDDQSFVASTSDAKALAAEATQRLGWNVPLPSLDRLNWTLESASTCTINDQLAARFHFRRNSDGKTATLLSMHECVWVGVSQSLDYVIKNNDHVIVGYRQDGGLHCIVADVGVSESDARTMRDTIQSN